MLNNIANMHLLSVRCFVMHKFILASVYKFFNRFSKLKPVLQYCQTEYHNVSEFMLPLIFIDLVLEPVPMNEGH